MLQQAAHDSMRPLQDKVVLQQQGMLKLLQPDMLWLACCRTSKRALGRMDPRVAPAQGKGMAQVLSCS